MVDRLLLQQQAKKKNQFRQRKGPCPAPPTMFGFAALPCLFLALIALFLQGRRAVEGKEEGRKNEEAKTTMANRMSGKFPTCLLKSLCVLSLARLQMDLPTQPTMLITVLRTPCRFKIRVRIRTTTSLVALRLAGDAALTWGGGGLVGWTSQPRWARHSKTGCLRTPFFSILLPGFITTRALQLASRFVASRGKKRERQFPHPTSTM